ncbi:MAG: phytanoyl-CoA dioxygenase family protein [Leucothrix sp.]
MQTANNKQSPCKAKENSDNRLGLETSLWFKTTFPNASLVLLLNHPWAKTWKVFDNDQVYFLKQLGHHEPQKIRNAKHISTLFKHTVPAIIKHNPELSVMVAAHHKGRELQSRSKHRHLVLTSYAKLQRKAIKHSTRLSQLPHFATDNIYQHFLNFLHPQALSNKPRYVNADYFIGESKSAQYYALFVSLTPLFETALQNLSTLPQTINHCDLRPPNMAIRPDKSLTIFDWDDAKWGPVGLSLHAQFSGCLRPYLALLAPPNALSAQQQTDKKHLDAYIDVFVKSNISNRQTLRDNLPASIVAGTLSYLLDFTHYASAGDRLRKTIGKNITKRLESLLDFIDAVSSTDEPKAKQLATSYFKHLRDNRLNALQKSFKQPLLDLPNYNDTAIRDAQKPDVFPTIKISDFERQQGVCSKQNTILATKIYREHGAVLLENSLSRELIEACRHYIFQQHQEAFRVRRPKESLRVGNKRFMITLPLEGPVNQPEVYAPPIIMRIMKQLLGNKFILGSMVVVTSLPGAKNQSRHRDHHALFPENNVSPPPFAVSVMIPLIDMNEEVGATRIYKGTHLQPTDIANKMPHQDPPSVPVGSCFLMDYRIQHKGMANQSKDKIRPVMTLIFQRPWFRDYVNYNNQERMLVSKSERLKVPKEHRHLFDWK